MEEGGHEGRTAGRGEERKPARRGRGRAGADHGGSGAGASQTLKEAAMIYQAKNHDHLFGTPGFSDEALKSHFTLYEGYVKNANKLLEDLDGLLKDGKSASPEYAELKRRFGWEYNGIRLHELYFENMTKRAMPGPDAGSDFLKDIRKDF